MNQFLDILNEVLRIATFQPTGAHHEGRRQDDLLGELQARGRYERRGRERFYG